MATSGLVQATFAAVAFCLALPTVTSIMCYQCNSYKVPECATLTHNTHNSSDNSNSSLYYQPCAHDIEGRQPFCRKTTITVIAAKSSRVIRACGWRPYKYDCYQVDDGDHQEVVCQCFSDGCNSAPTRSLLSPIVFFIATATILLNV